ARPDIALSGDFIVGFPGETEADFAATLRLVDAVGYAQAFSFKYSPRPGTPAASMDGQLPREVMDERLQRLQAALNRDQLAFNRASVGKRCEVLVERKGKKPGQWLGKSPWLQSVFFEGDAAIGEMVTVELAEAGPNSLHARLLQRAVDGTRQAENFPLRQVVVPLAPANAAPSFRIVPRKERMARKTTRAEELSALAHPEERRDSARRARAEVRFDEQATLGALFGEFDANLVQIENRLGVLIAARGNKVVIEGQEDEVARARQVLLAMHEKLLTGQDLDAGTIEALIAQSNEPTL